MKYDTGIVFAKHTAQIRDKSEQIIFETEKIPAIISREKFDRANEIRCNKIQHILQSDSLTGKGINHGATDYAQKVICGCCGSKYMVSNTKNYNGKFTRYYACTKKRQMSRDENGNRIMLCNNPNVSQETLDSVINSGGYTIKIWLKIRDGIKELTDIINALTSRIDAQSIDEIKAVEEQLSDVKKKKMKLLDLYLSDTFSKEQLDERVKPLDNQETELIEKIKALSKTNDDIYRDITEAEETLRYFQEQNRIIQEEVNNGKILRKYTKKKVLEDTEYIVVETDGSLKVKLKAYAEIEKLIQKHRYLVSKIA